MTSVLFRSWIDYIRHLKTLVNLQVPFAMETICIKKIEWKAILINSMYTKIHLEIKSTQNFYVSTLIIFSVVLNWCVTSRIVFHFESSYCISTIRLKMNQDLIAWRDMAGRNWITTILSHNGWCIRITIINSQWIITEKN